MKKIILLSALLGMAFIAKANNVVYEISAALYDKNQLIAAPVLIVNPNEEGGILIKNLYELSMKVTPVNKSKVKISSVLKFKGEKFSPSFLVNFAEEAKFKNKDIKLVLVVTKQPRPN